jgi:hypothetical protein
MIWPVLVLTSVLITSWVEPLIDTVLGPGVGVANTKVTAAQ